MFFIVQANKLIFDIDAHYRSNDYILFCSRETSQAPLSIDFTHYRF